MKTLITVIALLSTNAAFAYNGPFADRDYSDICKEQETDTSGSTLYCSGAANAKAVINAKVGASLTKLPTTISNKEVDAVFDLGVLPDADTDFIFNYYKKLVSSTGKVVGYMTIQGLVNSEMETRLKVNVRYNTKGELVMVDVNSF